MKSHNTKKSVAFLAAAILACQPVSALAVTFADINQAPWPGAETSINKAADLGLVVGETINGKSYFRPRDTVSLSESCQFAYKVLLQTNKVTADPSLTQKWGGIMNTYKIQSWAHPAVAFCLENGIISISDLSLFVKNGTNMPASREQAAEMLGRALVVGVPSLVATAGSTKFVDNSSISPEAVPFIALLNDEGIVNGDDTGRFNPKKTLNRTETAVMVTNLYQGLKNTNVVLPPVYPTSQSGTVKDMNSNYVNFVNSNAYYLYSTSGVTVTLNGKSSTVADVIALFKEGKEIKADLTLENKRIVKMVVTCEDAKEEEAEEKLTKGKLTKMSYDEDDNDGSITIDGKSTYKIKDVDDVDITVEMDDDEDDYDYDDFYDLYLECKDDKKPITVKLTMKGDKIDKIKATVGKAEKDKNKPEGDHVGDIKKLTYNSDDEGTIKIGSTTYDIEDVYDIDIQIDGDDEDWDELFDLYEEFKDDDEYLYGGITMDKKDKYVVEIDVVTKTSKGDTDGEVDEVTYNEKKEKGTIKIDGETYSADDIGDVDIDIEDGSKSTIDTWEELYEAYKDGKTMDVSLETSGDDVESIEGKVTAAKGYLTAFGKDYLSLEGKHSKMKVKYYFEVSDEKDEDDYEEETQEMLEDIDVDIDGSGMSGIDNLYEFIEWLQEAKDDDDLSLGKGKDEFDLVFKLDKNGYITEISGEYDY